MGSDWIAFGRGRSCWSGCFGGRRPFGGPISVLDQTKTDLVIVPFHGWEYSIAGILVLCFAFYHPIFLAAIIGHLSHVATDHFHNRLTLLGYFVLYRAWVRFDACKIAPGRDSAYFHHNLTSFFPFRSLWEPWYLRKVGPWFDARGHNISEDRITESKS